MSQYCTPNDVITYAIPATALPKSITQAQLTAACISASAEADSYMRARYALPITGSVAGGPGVYDPALVRHTAYIAAFTIMSGRGFAPGAGTDQNIRENYYAARGWPDRPGSGFFPGVERQHIHLDVTYNTPTPPQYNLPQVHSRPPRGF